MSAQPNLAAEILAWAEPMVRDRIDSFWLQAARSQDAARAIADQHWRVWRCALAGMPHGAAANRRKGDDPAIRAVHSTRGWSPSATWP